MKKLIDKLFDMLRYRNNPKILKSSTCAIPMALIVMGCTTIARIRQQAL